MGRVDYISRHPNQKAKKLSAYDEEFIVAKLDLISASANSLNLKSWKSTPHLEYLLKLHNHAPRITTNCETAIKSINTIIIFDTRLHKHEFTRLHPHRKIN